MILKLEILKGGKTSFGGNSRVSITKRKKKTKLLHDNFFLSVCMRGL